MKRRILLGAGVGAAALAAGTGFSLYRSRESGSEIEPALWQLSFEQASGGTLTMASLRGRPLLLNFWATWCAPCIKELPMLDRVHREKRAAGWQVVGIAVDGPTPVRVTAVTALLEARKRRLGLLGSTAMAPST